MYIYIGWDWCVCVCLTIDIQPGYLKCGSLAYKISQLVTKFNDQHHMSIYYVAYIGGKKEGAGATTPSKL